MVAGWVWAVQHLMFDWLLGLLMRFLLVIGATIAHVISRQIICHNYPVKSGASCPSGVIFLHRIVLDYFIIDLLICTQQMFMYHPSLSAPICGVFTYFQISWMCSLVQNFVFAAIANMFHSIAFDKTVINILILDVLFFFFCYNISIL